MAEQVLRYFDCKISSNEPAKTKILDPVEGNIDITFYLKEESNLSSSYTEFRVVDSHNAVVDIVNALEQKQVSLPQSIEVGTYGGRYDLYMQYTLHPADETGQRSLRVVYLINEKK